MNRIKASSLRFSVLLTAVILLVAPDAVFAEDMQCEETGALTSRKSAVARVAVDPSKGYDGTELPVAPRMEGDVWTVTPENAQYALDGAYGAIDGKTIRFTGGPYTEILVLARTTKYPGSATACYDQSYAATGTGDPKAVAELTPTGVYCYVRTVQDVTLQAESGVVLPGFSAASGHVYGTGSSPAYDYVRETSTTSTNGSHYDFCSLKNIVFEGLAIQDRVLVADSSAYARTVGLRFENCTFLGDANSMGDANYAAVKMMSDAKSFEAVTVSRCTFSNYFQGVYIQGPVDPKIVRSVFDATTHNAIALQSSERNPIRGDVTISENIIRHAGDRAIRFGDASGAASVTVTNNVMVDSGDSGGELFKAEALPLGERTVSLEHNYWDGRQASTAVAGSIVPITTGVAGGTFSEELKPEYCAEGFEVVPDGNGGFIVCDHSETETRSDRAATCCEKGYTGDEYCMRCGILIAKGTETPLQDHVFSWVVEREPTDTEAGSQCEVCDSCGYRGRCIEIPATGAPDADDGELHVEQLPAPHDSVEKRQPAVALGLPMTGDAEGVALGVSLVLLAGVCAAATNLASRRRRTRFRDAA